MDSEGRSQLLQLQEMLYAPGQSLANILRRAVVVASMLGKHEYRILFGEHLDGLIKGAPGRSGSAKWPGGYNPEIDPYEAFEYDRKRRDKKIVVLSVDEMEALYHRATSAVSSGSADNANYLQIHHGLTLQLGRIRNRVNFFVANRLANLSTASQGTSSLTGLLSLSEFSKDLDALLHTHQRHLSIAFADMDNLKALNSRIGHDNADKVIKRVASILAGALRSRGTLYHRSGDEFLAILENHTAAEAAMLMDRVCQRVAEHDFEQGLAPGTVTISVGVVEHEVHATGADALREAAERANRTAKDAGKNCVLVLPSTEPDPAP